jgi:spore coat polysaccharide biosynthesis protein SpsF (cytidylyltransferase family)
MENNAFGAILIYVRLGSTRLPEKALKPIGNFKLIELIFNRLKSIENQYPIKLYLATTKAIEDNKLAAFGQSLNISVFRGDEKNLVDRTLEFINQTNYRYICRVNGDCPFVDLELICKGFDYIREGYDFVTNIKKRTFPYGVAVEWFNSDFYKNYSGDVLEKEKEHVTMHLYRLINEINHFNIESEIDNSKFNLTIDTHDDYNKIITYFKNLTKENQINLSYKKILKNDYTI